MSPTAPNLVAIAEKLDTLSGRVSNLSSNLQANVRIADDDRREYRKGIGDAMSRIETCSTTSSEALRDVQTSVENLRNDLNLQKAEGEKVARITYTNEKEVAHLKGGFQTAMMSVAEKGKKHSWLVTVALAIEFVSRHWPP